MILYITDAEESAISTIVIRGSTDNVMDDIERAIDDGVNTFKALTKVRDLWKRLNYSLTLYTGKFFTLLFFLTFGPYWLWENLRRDEFFFLKHITMSGQI